MTCAKIVARYKLSNSIFAEIFLLTFSAYTTEFRYNIKLAYPVIIGMVGHTITGLVDNVMVGKLGITELAAVSLGNSILFIAISIGIGFSTAITPIVAEADAAEDTGRIRSAFFHGMILCVILGLLLFASVVFSKPLLIYLHQPKAVLDLALPYIDLVAFSLVPMIIYQGYKQFADGLSMTKQSMYAIILANVMNIILNYLFIYGFWIIPAMGVQGAALGTVISRILMVVFMHLFMVKNEKLNPYFSRFKLVEFSKSIFRKILNIGFPSAMQMLFEISIFTAAIWLSGIIGENSQAANQIALTMATFTFMFAMGLSVTAMIRVSNQKGLKNYKHLLVVARSIFLLAIIIEIIFALLFVVLHSLLPQAFLDMSDVTRAISNQEVIAIAAKLLLVAAVFQIFDGIQVVALGALRGLQDVKVPMYITFVAYWIIGFPLCYYLGLHTKLGAVGIWIGLLAGLAAAALFLYIRFEKLCKMLIAKND